MTLLQALAGQHMLVILDNCEHVRPEAAALVDALRARPTITVLATSRERLGLRDEREIAVRPLPADDETAPAIELFIERAARPALLDDPAERTAIVEICRRLDGLPLAVELAASRCRAMQPSAMVTRISDSLRLLSDRTATDTRRATIDGTLRWSHDLLDARDQAVFRRLGIMVGYFDLDTAEHVCGFDGLDQLDVDDAVGSLVDKSLVDHDDGWYRLLESTRQFAVARLGESGELEAARAAHLDWAVAYAREHDQRIRTAEEARWAQHLDRLWPNVRAAYENALTADDATFAFTIATFLTNEVVVRRFEALDWLERALDRFGRDDHPLLADVLAGAALAKLVKADFEAMAVLATEAIERAGTNRTKDRAAEMVLGYALAYGGWADEAMSILVPALHSTISEGNTYAIGVLVTACGNAAMLGASDRTFVDEGLRVIELPGISPTDRVTTRVGLALAAIGDGDLDRARHHVTAALDVVEETRSLAEIGAIRGIASWVTQPSLEEAVLAIRELLRAGHVAFAWLWVPSAAAGLLDTQPELSARLIGAAKASNPSTAGSGATVETELQERLGRSRADELIAEGAPEGLAVLEQLFAAGPAESRTSGTSP